MTRARALVALAAVAAALAVAGCGGSGGTGDSRPRLPAIDQGGERWQALQGTLGARFDQDGQNACVRGARTCVPVVVAEMRRRLDVLAGQCSHLAPFALMYLDVTAGVEQAQRRGERFRDLPYLAHLDAVFAGFYFRAFDAWRNGRDREVPAAWRLAFEAADRKVVSGIGDLMLGMNAHISRDLPFALAASGLQGTDGQSARPDFDAVNALLNTTAGPMIDEQARRFDPSVKSFTAPVLGISSLDLGALLWLWRTEAYRNAEKLIAAPTPAARRRVAAAIEADAAQRARLIQVATSYAVLGGSTAARDRFCARRSA
ncbi:MAG TPA: DUF5995 family protein [Solirubrobacteraceae bacterium]